MIRAPIPRTKAHAKILKNALPIIGTSPFFSSGRSVYLGLMVGSLGSGIVPLGNESLTTLPIGLEVDCSSFFSLGVGVKVLQPPSASKNIVKKRGRNCCFGVFINYSVWFGNVNIQNTTGIATPTSKELLGATKTAVT